jgi:acylphosphatase
MRPEATCASKTERTTRSADEWETALSQGRDIARHLSIRGRVQGVGYRAWAESEAIRRGLEGFVRNRRDGSVEALLVGDAAVVAEMITACRSGPPGAWVEDIAESAGSAAQQAERRPGERFSVLPTV